MPTRRIRNFEALGLPGCALLAALALSACGTPSSPPLQALESCRAEVNAVIGTGDWQPTRLRRVDDCMRARGWRPSKACVETAQQGSNFCDYTR